MTPLQIIQLTIAIGALLGHVPAVINAIKSRTGNNSAPAAPAATSNAPQTPPAQP